MFFRLNYENIAMRRRCAARDREGHGRYAVTIEGDFTVQQGIERFLDEEGKLKMLPSKQIPREQVYTYLAGKFECGRDYTEHEVNAILSSWHTFQDYFVLRRGLIESGWLCRMKDGSRYWRNPEKREE